MATAQEQKIEALDRKIVSLEKQIGTLRSAMIRNGQTEPYDKESGLCLVDADQDPSDCPWAGTYRYQQNCRGEACVTKNREYYSSREHAKAEAKRAELVAKGVKMPPAKKGAAKKASAPTKKAVAKTTARPVKKVATKKA